jgi:FAD:protein FMN transferase
MTVKTTKILMGMPITIEVIDPGAEPADVEEVFSYFSYIDEKFSTYKKNSEISKINDGLLKPEDFSEDMKTVFALSANTKTATGGYFDIQCPDGKIDPSGLVKGWAILNAANLLTNKGYKDFYVEAGGDIEAKGKNTEGGKWSVGIKNPFNQEEIVKVVYLSGGGMATSGSYIRGNHIYNPHKPSSPISDIVSLTVVGPNAYEADRFATAAFAMGKQGINFIEKLNGFEGYMIDNNKVATLTSNFKQYLS